MCANVYKYACALHESLGLTESEEVSDLWHWSYRWLWASFGCWESNLGHLHGQLVCSNTEPALQLHDCFVNTYFIIDFVCPCVWVHVPQHTCTGWKLLVRGSCLLPPCESWGLTSGCQACQQAPLPIGLFSCPPGVCRIFKPFFWIHFYKCPFVCILISLKGLVLLPSLFVTQGICTIMTFMAGLSVYLITFI